MAIVACVVAVLAVVHGASAGASIRMHRQPHSFTVVPEGSSTPFVDSRHTVKLSGGLLNVGAYFAQVDIGTPAQTFTVLIDTGSSNLAVADSSCDDGLCGVSGARYDASLSSTAEPIACTSDACRTCNLHNNPGECLFAEPFCDPADTSVCGGSISYGGSSSFIRGAYVTDVVTFGGLTTRTGLLSINNQAPAQSFSGNGLGGILGLAHEWNAVNPTYIPTLLKNLVDSKQMDDLFSMCLSPSDGGVLDLGFIDSTKYTGELQYVNVTKQRWYNLKLNDIKFNGTSVGLHPSAYWVDNDSIGTFIDSGTSVMLFAPLVYSAIVNTWQSNFCHLPHVCGASGTTIFDGVCLSGSDVAALSSFPDFEFIFEGSDGSPVALKVPAKSYMMPNGGQYCWSSSGVTGINGVLGDVFLENFYTVYDRQRGAIGFAPIGNCS